MRPHGLANAASKIPAMVLENLLAKNKTELVDPSYLVPLKRKKRNIVVEGNTA